VRERGWPVEQPHVPMAGDGRGRVPRGAGRHVLIVGATGSGKTVSARRWLLARVVGDGVGVLVCDPKGDRGLEGDLRAVARVVGRPFVVFDPRDPNTDRWNPLWSDDIGAVVSRLVAPIAAGEGNARYYADLLQIHLGAVASGLRAAGLWPANLPLLLDAAQLGRYDRLLGAVRDAAASSASASSPPRTPGRAGARRRRWPAACRRRGRRRRARVRWSATTSRPPTALTTSRTGCSPPRRLHVRDELQLRAGQLPRADGHVRLRSRSGRQRLRRRLRGRVLRQRRSEREQPLEHR
jgi:hypothetical protein